MLGAIRGGLRVRRLCGSDADRVAAFLEQMHDWGDIWGDIDAGAHVQAEFSINEALKDVTAARVAFAYRFEL